MSKEIEQARERYQAAIGGDDHDEFVAAKRELVELTAGRQLTDDEVAYM
ncbi:hypothetical protein RE9431_48180 (plasmid) [Prescottella equi]|uniref:Uncharacterized protein n=1 Tax=Rhodococcus hoagii TaxID=43767 RepID=A0A0F7IC61_RHOHA|nr:hypothetical protein [Prescottella equi]AKF15965.1 hypothetical protein pVAPN2012_0060 [Prescottella equi]AKG90465.1 hypothetical protein pVAPN_0060 [Prescottella equi]ARX59613.1 hypothetical protein pVAPN1204_0060 [Prescottella equi]ARX59756.1 hypothetical protein pVAPN1354_0060 [Prescottella equi]ARX59903.1 hypothetical protein pVAPN1557_0060 [Prescottella equi]